MRTPPAVTATKCGIFTFSTLSYMSCCKDDVSLAEFEKLLFISVFDAVMRLKDNGFAEVDFRMAIMPVFVVMSFELV